MNEQEEQYIYFVSSIESLNNAWIILQEIRKIENKSFLIGAAFRFALIEYSKPYKTTYGVIQKTNIKSNKIANIKYSLDAQFVPLAFLDLHERILLSRDKIHAHADLSIKDAKLYVTNTSSGKIVSKIQNIVYGTEEIKNIDAIIELIEQTLDNMYIEAKVLETALPLN